MIGPQVFGVWDPRGRADRLDDAFSRLCAAFRGTPAVLDGRGAAEDPAARVLRLGAVRAEGDPARLIRRGGDGAAAVGAVRLRRAPGTDAADQIDALTAALAAGAFDAPSPVAPLEGAYALISWSPDKGLRLLRDAMGAAPLWLTRLDGGALAFATWPHALRALPEVGADPDPERLRQISVFRRLPPGGALWPGMSSLPPGHRIAADAQGATLHRWWAPGPDPALADLPDAARVAVLSERISDAVATAWQGLGPGARLMFSGGLDSSLLAGLLCAADPGREVAALVSVGAGGGGEGDRAARAAMVRRWPNLRPVEAPAEGLDPFEGDAAIWRTLAEPNCDPSYFNTLAMSRQARDLGAQGVLTGFGGDQAVSMLSRGALVGAVRGLRWAEARQCAAALRHRGVGRRGLAQMVLRGFPGLNKALRPEARLSGMRGWAPDPAGAQAREVPWAAEGLVLDDRVPRDLLADEREQLLEIPELGLQPVPLGPGAELVQAAPLLDTGVTAAMMAISWRAKTENGVERAVVRRLLSQVAPDEVAFRRGKDPFQPDMGRLMHAGLPRLRADLRGFAADLPLWREIVDVQALEARLARVDAVGGERGLVMLASAYHAWFLGRFLMRAAADPGGDAGA